MKDECVNGGCPTNIILRKIFTLTICVLSHIREPKQSNQALFALQQLLKCFIVRVQQGQVVLSS